MRRAAAWALGLPLAFVLVLGLVVGFLQGMAWQAELQARRGAALVMEHGQPVGGSAWTSRP